MKIQRSIAAMLLLAAVGIGPVRAERVQTDPSAARATSNLPSRSGEASTMTDGVPNLVTSNLQPGELGIETRLTVRRATPVASALPPYAGDPSLKTMGAAGPMRPVMISPPGAAP
jgi:hypothetical protein